MSISSIRKIKIKVNRRFNVSNTILKIEVVYADVKAAIAENFIVLKKCRCKLDCLVYKLLLMKELKPSLNVQSDSMREVIHLCLTKIFKLHQAL